MPGSRRAAVVALAGVVAFVGCASRGGPDPGWLGGAGVKAGGSGAGAASGATSLGKSTAGSGATGGAGRATNGGASEGSGGAQAPAGAGGHGGAGNPGKGDAGGSDALGRGGRPNDPGGEAGAVGAGAGGSDGSDDPEIPVGYVKAIIGVGYGGIRIVSRDGGNTWGDRTYAAPDGGDDDDLLRAVAYGKGRWIATGWKLMSSDDGIHWTDHGKLEDGIIAHNPIIEGLAYKAGYFYAAGDGGSGAYVYRSSDGLAWSDFARGGDTVKHTGLAIHAGSFVSYGDSETSYQSTDAMTWTDMGIADATYCEGAWRSLDACHDAFWFDDGFYLLPEWGGEIRRSTTGSNFETVYTDDQKNTLYRARAVAEGYVAPE